jgi:hypothetical protein
MKCIKIFFFLSLVLLFSQCKKEDVAAANSLNKLSIGKSAHDLLSADKYKAMVIQILYMPGNDPDASAINNTLAFLNELVNKPAGISVLTKAIPASGKSTLTLSDIKAIENEHRTVFNTGSTIGVCIIYLDGEYSGANTLGIAYLNTSMAVFGPTMKQNSGGINQPSRTRLESIILTHEFGHNLGLVDLGSPMQVNHKASNSSHCDVTNCLMYFSTTVGQMGGILNVGPLPALDANCKNDLRANGGK